MTPFSTWTCIGDATPQARLPNNAQHAIEDASLEHNVVRDWARRMCLYESPGEARALGIVALCVNCLLLNLHALVMHVVPMVVLMAIGDLQLGPAGFREQGQSLLCSHISFP
jgi:hypothetical protein